MKIGVVGASAAGLYAAILIAKRHPDFHVIVLEKNDKAGKKLLATGNGHCNLLNNAFAGKFFNHPEFVDALLKDHSAESLLNELHELGIATLVKDELVYPLSYNAAAHVRYLVTLAEKLGVEFRYGEKVIEAKDAKLKTDKGNYAFDHVVYAFGGCSQANLGSDGSMFPLLQKSGYKVVPLEPSLCPLQSPDVPKSLFGVRHKCKLSLTKDNRLIYEEKGEVIFKKDGLSGIAVMNASSRLEKGALISLDLFPDIQEAEMKAILQESYQQNPDEFLAPVLEKPLADFIMQKSNISCKAGLKQHDFERICAVFKNLQFRISGKYDFASSQVTRGGIDLSEVDQNLRSKREPNVSFIGECLDVDGMCGGFNLGWALLSAKVVSLDL